MIQTLLTSLFKALFLYNLIQFSATENNNEVQVAYRPRFG